MNNKDARAELIPTAFPKGHNSNGHRNLMRAREAIAHKTPSREAKPQRSYSTRNKLLVRNTAVKQKSSVKTNTFTTETIDISPARLQRALQEISRWKFAPIAPIGLWSVVLFTFGWPTPTSFAMFPFTPAWHSANKNACTEFTKISTA